MKCPLCKREVEKLTRHHLRPNGLNHPKGQEKALICLDCHRRIHILYSNEDLREKYNTLEKLKKAPKVIEYLNRVEKIPVRADTHHVWRSGSSMGER